MVETQNTTMLNKEINVRKQKQYNAKCKIQNTKIYDDYKGS